MRDQYAGDVSDLLKFAFLRALASTDRTLGIAWYYAPGDDGRPDGRHLEWRDEIAWLKVDPKLHTELVSLPERSVAALERAAIWPIGTLFHREPIPSWVGRATWSDQKRAILYDADLVFLDPDNGLRIKPKKKHATFSEVKSLRRAKRSIAFITFPGRNKTHDELVKELHKQLSVEAGVERAITLRTSVSIPSVKKPGTYVPRQRWFTVTDPTPELIARVRTFAHALESVPRVRTHEYTTA